MCFFAILTRTSSLGSIEVDSTSTGGPFDYQWIKNDTYSTVISVDDSSGILCEGTYYIIITDSSSGCSLTDTLDATFYLPNGIVDLTTTSVLDVSNLWGHGSTYYYLWSSGEITEDIEDLTANNYSVTVSDSYGCESIHNMIIDEPLELESNPIITNASCEEKPDGIIDISPYGGTSPYSYLWSNGQITEDIENLFTGDYWVTITDFNDCEETDSIYLDFDGFEDCFFIPTLFTPNGDGVHDNWQIDGVSVFPDITVKIFNRWGQLLFESVGYTQRWDGTYKGKELPIAAYYYIIDMMRSSCHKHQYFFIYINFRFIS